MSVSSSDHQFIDDFLCSYRSFLGPSELLDFLLERYNLTQSTIGGKHNEDASLSMSPALFQKQLPQVQLRVLDVLLKWTATHFYDFEGNPQLLSKLIDFINNELRTHKPNEQHYEKLRLLILEQVPFLMRKEEEEPERVVARQQASEVLVDKNSPPTEIVVVMQREDLGIKTQIFQKKRGKKYVCSFNGSLMYHFRRHHPCSRYIYLNEFKCNGGSGIDFVDWCRDKLKIHSASEAIEMGERMLKQNLIRSLQKRERSVSFRISGTLYYRFSRRQMSGNSPVARIPNNINARLELMDIDTIELTRQFTLHSESLYRHATFLSLLSRFRILIRFLIDAERSFLPSLWPT